MNKPDIFFLPIEPLEERYSAQMLGWVERAFVELGLTHKTLLPKKNYENIQHGQWLDTYGTTRYRSQQMELVVECFEKGEVRDDAYFVVGDAWYPGIEAIKLMADLSGLKNVRVIGWHYAGTADPADLLHRETGVWAYSWENWLVNNYLDAIAVGSKFHANLLSGHFGVYDNVYPVGLAWRPMDVIHSVQGKDIQKERIVVFPHRLAPEKNPEGFYQLAQEFGSTSWRFVVSTNNPYVAMQVPKNKGVEVVCHDTKQQYYEFLASCSIYYSNATQETFGYALHEAIALGLSVAAPNRCSYPEMLQNDPRFCYSVQDDPLGRPLLARRMDEPVAVPLDYTLRWNAGENVFLTQVLTQHNFWKQTKP